MKILHRIRGETGKRCLSFLLAFAMLAGLIPEILPKAEAATGGVPSFSYPVTSANWEMLDSGGIHVWGTGVARKANSNLGIISVDGPYYSAQDVYGYAVYNRQFTYKWTDTSKKESFTFDSIFYPEYPGRQNFNFIVVDTTTGQYLTSSLFFTADITEKNFCSTYSIPDANFIYEVSPGANSFYYDLWTGSGNGRAITDYRVLWSTDQKNWSDKLICTQPKGGQKGFINGLQNGTTYYVKFQATNLKGTATSTLFTAVPGTPTAPQNPRVEPGDGCVVFSWDPPSDMRGGQLLGYNIYSTAAETEPIAILDANTRTYSLSPQTNGVVSYGSRVVRARVSYGVGEPAQFGQVWVGSPQSPTAPTLTKTAGSRSVRISVNAPANNGAAIIQYNIYVDGTLKKTMSGETLNASLDWKTDLGLADNTTYSVAVSATNSRGEGPQSPASSFTTNGPPAKPTLSNAEATKVTGQVKLTWTTPANNGGPITAVQVLQNGSVVKTLSASGTPNEWQSGKMDTPGQTCAYFVTGLTDGATYKFQVRAVNAYGQGVLSNEKNAMPYRVPDAPMGLKVTSGVRSLTLNWTAAANGGNSVSKYNVCTLEKC